MATKKPEKKQPVKKADPAAARKGFAAMAAMAGSKQKSKSKKG